MRDQLPYWNHNTAYFRWIRGRIGDRCDILDVGCGDGVLCRYLDTPGRRIIGIDPSGECIARARVDQSEGEQRFLQCTFEEYECPLESLDAIVFLASLHHMDAALSIDKATALLRPGGVLIVVGLAKPGTLRDWVIEALRVVPARIGSVLHHEEDSEFLGIPTSYRLNTMDEIRQIIEQYLPGAVLKNGLYFRYLLSWEKA